MIFPEVQKWTPDQLKQLEQLWTPEQAEVIAETWSPKAYQLQLEADGKHATWIETLVLRGLIKALEVSE